MGFFGRVLFDEDAKKQFLDDWSKMTDSEKLDFMNRKVERLGQDRFSVEAMDARCEAWMEMSQEEKEVFVAERKKKFEERIHGRCGFGHN